MTYLGNEGDVVMNKFYGERTSLWKFKMEMFLASMNLWDIVNESKKALPSNANRKVLKEFLMHIKKVVSIISLNLADNQLVHIKNCKWPVETWNTLCNIHQTKILSNILLVHCKFFICKVQEGNYMSTDQLTCLEVTVMRGKHRKVWVLKMKH